MAEAFRTSWDNVYQAVQLAVAWGLAQRDLGGIEAIGVDEVLWHRGHKSLTVVYQIDAHCRRLLWIGKDRTTETLENFFRWFGLRAQWLNFVCTDMWKPYLDVLSRKARNAFHVLDQVPGGVLIEACMRGALTTSTLVEENQPVALGIEIATVFGNEPPSRSAMYENGRLTLGIPALLDVDLVDFRDFQA